MNLLSIDRPQPVHRESGTEKPASPGLPGPSPKTKDEKYPGNNDRQ